MKNRDNEFFREEELDELVEKRDYETLREKMSRIFTCPCCLNGFKHCRKYLEVFSKEEIRKTPTFAAAEAVIQAIYGNLEKAEKYASYVGDERLMKLHLDVIIPGTDRKEQLKGWVKSFYGDSSLGIAEITYAEVCYQRDECFEAITTLVGIIPFIEKEGEIAVLFIALSLQMRIMIATGQIAVVYPILEEIYQRLHKEQSRWLLENFGAMKAWGLMYDGDVDTVTEWMENEAPSEFGELNMLDTYKYMIKMRAYILEEKYLAMLSLAEYLREPLRKGDRVMDLCEMNLLCAVSYFLSDRKEEAFQLLDELLPIVKERRFDRLIADEGEKVYMLLRAYRQERQIKDEYLNRLIQLAKKMALLYPDYLRKAKEDYPPLTKSEQEILRLMADERSNQEIADFMGISINTVKFHGKNIFAKLRVRTRRQAVRVAKENRLLSLR